MMARRELIRDIKTDWEHNRCHATRVGQIARKSFLTMEPMGSTTHPEELLDDGPDGQHGADAELGALGCPDENLIFEMHVRAAVETEKEKPLPGDRVQRELACAKAWLHTLAGGDVVMNSLTP